VKNSQRIVVVFLVLAGVGCVTYQDSLRSDAAAATGCSDVQVLEAGSEIGRVTACGKQLTCYWRQKAGRDQVDRLTGIGGHWECSRSGD
jgi:hypothetical protein